jgi:acetyltransferase-like isoleucine patch superfamily enzyme
VVLPRRVLRVPSGTVVAPWGVPAAELRVLGVPLRERQDRVLARLGLRVEATCDPADVGADADTLYLDDDVDLAAGTLRNFLKRAGPGSRLALAERPRRVGELEVEPAAWFRDGEVGPEELPGSEPVRLLGVRWGDGRRGVRVEPLGFSGKGTLPGPFGDGQTLEWAIDLRTGVTVRHWVHVLRATYAAIGVGIWEQLVLAPWSSFYTWLRWPLHPRVARIGRRCQIHPTARLEGCILEDDVHIGAYSVLRGCWVGSGTHVEDHVTARLSAIGPRAHVGNYSMFNLSSIGERSSVGHIGAQASVIGDDCFVSTFATLHDLNLRGNVRVRFGERLVDTGVPFLGVALGNGVRLGAGVTIASGREVPNGVHVVAEGAVARIPVDLPPGEYTASGGRLVPDPEGRGEG